MTEGPISLTSAWRKLLETPMFLAKDRSSESPPPLHLTLRRNFWRNVVTWSVFLCSAGALATRLTVSSPSTRFEPQLGASDHSTPTGRIAGRPRSLPVAAHNRGESHDFDE
jgi:hypothetical protein